MGATGAPIWGGLSNPPPPALGVTGSPKAAARSNKDLGECNFRIDEKQPLARARVFLAGWETGNFFLLY